MSSSKKPRSDFQKEVDNRRKRLKRSILNAADAEDRQAGLDALEILTRPLPVYAPTDEDERDILRVLGSRDFLSLVEQDYEENALMRDVSVFDLLDEVAKAAFDMSKMSQRRVAALPSFPRRVP